MYSKSGSKSKSPSMVPEILASLKEALKWEVKVSFSYIFESRNDKLEYPVLEKQWLEMLKKLNIPLSRRYELIWINGINSLENITLGLLDPQRMFKKRWTLG